MSAVKGAPKPSLRVERAQVTRTRIADAARTLFSTRGYGSTTLTAIASEAGVAVQTVYAVYGSKAGILRALREAVLRQPDAEALFEEAMRQRDPDGQLQLFARSIRQRWEHGHDVVAIHQDAAATDPTLRREVEAVLAIRRNGIGRLAGSLEPALAPRRRSCSRDRDPRRPDAPGGLCGTRGRAGLDAGRIRSVAGFDHTPATAGPGCASVM